MPDLDMLENNAALEVDWTAVSSEVAREILAQGEMFMQCQLQTAIASDQRAITAASFFATLSGGIIAGTIAYWDRTGDIPILLGGLSTFAVSILGTFLCLWAARPVTFYFPGNHPAQWYASRFEALNVSLGGEAENYQIRIERNAACLTANARALVRGATAAAASPVVGLSVWITASFFLSFPEVTRPASCVAQLWSSLDGILRIFR